MHTGEGYHIGSLPFLEELRWYPRLRAPFFRPNRVIGYALSPSPSPFRAGGKEENMSIPYVKGFDYTLSRSEDGRCWARVRATGEMVEISEEVMRELRREEKKEYRFQMTLEQRKEESKKTANADPNQMEKAESDIDSETPETGEDIEARYFVQHPLPLEGTQSDEKCNSWEESPTNIEGEVIGLTLTEQLIAVLTPKQKDCFVCCVIWGESKSDYAKRTGISARRVTTIFRQIQQKLKKLI